MELGFRMKVLTMEKNLRFIMVGGMEAIPLLFIYKNLKSRLLLLETSFLEECILLTLSSLFEDFPLEREKIE